MAFDPTDEQVSALDLFTEGESMVIEAGAGCLAADTLVHLNRGGKGSRFTVEQVAHQVAGTATFQRTLNGKRITQRARPWDPAIQTRIARAEGEVVRLGPMARAWYSGEKATWTVRTESGRAIRATWGHPFLTVAGWLPLSELVVGLAVLVNDERSTRGRGPKRQYRNRYTRCHPHQVRRSTKRERFSVAEHRLVIEAEMNDLTLDQYLGLLGLDEVPTGLRFLDPAVHVHHEDEDPQNNARSNLVVLNPLDHHRLHAAEGVGDNVLWRVGQEIIAEIAPYGIELTYDIEVADAPHNFIANGFVVHNTGKTSTLQMLAESTPRFGRYLAFNKSIVRDVSGRLPDRCIARTAHSLAFQAVGRPFAHRLGGDRMKSFLIARMLDLDPFTVTYTDGQRKRLAAEYLAGHVMRGIVGFCQSADEAPTRRHFPYIDGIDLPTERGQRTYENNNRLAEHLEPKLAKAWADLSNPLGQLPYRHDHYLKCQPPGTMVRLASGSEIPIEKVGVAQRVVSWATAIPGRGSGRIRKTGGLVTHVGERHYSGHLVTAATPSGKRSRYTPDHICVARVGAGLNDKVVVYLMGRDGNFRIGRTPWRYGSQDNTLGIVSRARSQDADSVWILSAHSDDRAAALAEAVAAHRFGIPTWQFRSTNEFMPLNDFWAVAGGNGRAAEDCLAAHGRIGLYPLWQRGGHRHWNRQAITIRACNLMDGMRVCEIDRIMPRGKGELVPSDAWQPIAVGREQYEGPVHSIEVDLDHTYVADGILTHNCWQLSHPVTTAEYLLFDEAQDASPVMAAVVAEQHHAQRVYVGDSCQPPGTLVQVVVGRGRGRGKPSTIEDRPIEALVVGDRVVSFDRSDSHLHRRGRAVLGVSIRPFAGDLVVAKCDGRLSRYTPDHRCIVKIGDALASRHLVYLMRRGAQYRVGRASGSYGGMFGPMARAAAEGADALWVLSEHDTAAEAALAEAQTAWLFGVPTLTFIAGRGILGQDRLDAFWAVVGPNGDSASAVAAAHGRDLRFPLWEQGAGKLLLRRSLVIRACNVMEGMRMLPADAPALAEGKSLGSRWWRPVAIDREHYTGPVYSLSVAEHETYVADGLVTHNCQAIYEFTGAINSIAEMRETGVSTRRLTNSFRFGPAIADEANVWLELLDTDLRLSGLGAPSTVGALDSVDDADAILCRTNAGAMTALLKAQQRGVVAHLIGGGDQVLSFARAAGELMTKGQTYHPELACFESWGEVRAYVSQDPAGGELRLLVDLIEEFGVEVIQRALGAMPSEEGSSLVITTAHKAKGREWPVVSIDGDFSECEMTPSQLRLEYVSITRARDHLDHCALDPGDDEPALPPVSGVPA